MLTNNRLGIVGALAILAAGVGLAILLFFVLSGTSQTGSGKAQIGGAFSLTDQYGQTVTEQSLRGKPSIMFFGFTNCPEVCPTTLYEITQMLEQLGNDADKINTVFVSVDPERDTQAQLAQYLTAFDPHIIGLTGPVDEIARTAKAFRVYYKKVPLDGGDYTVDHTALVYMFDKDGEFIAPLNTKQGPETAAAAVRKLL